MKIMKSKLKIFKKYLKKMEKNKIKVERNINETKEKHKKNFFFQQRQKKYFQSLKILGNNKHWKTSLKKFISGKLFG